MGAKALIAGISLAAMSLNVMKLAILWLSAISGRGYRAGGIGSGSFPASSFFDREYRTILGLLAEPRKR